MFCDRRNIEACRTFVRKGRSIDDALRQRVLGFLGRHEQWIGTETVDDVLELDAGVADSLALEILDRADRGLGVKQQGWRDRHPQNAQPLISLGKPSRRQL